MLGASGVGKTSLVDRFVSGVFSEKYLTTVGVRISRKAISSGPHGKEELILWDLNGEDRFQSLATSYLRGMAGYLLVVDGTRAETLDTALSLHERISAAAPVPFVLLLNKSDLRQRWEVDNEQKRAISDRDWTIVETSAKSGEGVERSFVDLADMIRGSS
jgi:small GTP-binding protein